MTFIIDYLIPIALAILATTLITILGLWVGTKLVKFIKAMITAWMRQNLYVMGYRSFYPDNDSIEKDIKCHSLLRTVREVYEKNSSFDGYFPRLSKERVPIYVIMNWARSMSEDIFTAQMPISKVDQWNHFFKSKLYRRVSVIYEDFPIYEESEMGCLWGIAYYRLALIYEKDMNDPTMTRIAQLACKSKISTPYFHHFYAAVRCVCSTDYFLTDYINTGQAPFVEAATKFEHTISDSVCSTDFFVGFESLSVNERCKARQVLNDVLSESEAWKSICREMKRRGWFKEEIVPRSSISFAVAGDYVWTKHVGYEVNGVESGGVGVSLNKDKK